MNRKRRIYLKRERNRKIKRGIFVISVIVIAGVGACTKRAEYQEESVRVSAEIREGRNNNATNHAGEEKEPDEQEIRRLLAKDEFGQELEKLYCREKRVGEIIRNRKSYPDKLIETLIKYPETIEYVLGYPHRGDSDELINISDEVQKGSIPLFIQWDKRWGYRSYGDSMIGITGCGPTCLSMVVTGLTGNKQWNPAKMAQYSERNGYWVKGTGTGWELMGAGAEQFGLTVSRVPLSGGTIYRELMNGHPVICSMKPGDFTYTGHFIVLTGIDQEGKVLLNDPNSRVRSEKTWEMERIQEQIKSAWAYSV